MFRFILTLQVLFMVTLPVEAIWGYDNYYHTKHHPFCWDYNIQRIMESMFCRAVCRSSSYRTSTWYPFFRNSEPTFPTMSTNTMATDNELFSTTLPYSTTMSNEPSPSMPPNNKSTKSKTTEPPIRTSATPATSTIKIPSEINNSSLENAPPNNTLNVHGTENRTLPNTTLLINTSTTTGPRISTTVPIKTSTRSTSAPTIRVPSTKPSLNDTGNLDELGL